ncbi:MAG: hypothetical protein C0410_00315, partial [Anaerolinea sp.]|nr:hypothetical protein [Anaerolinea sp.]
DPLKKVATFFTAHVQPGDVVVHSNKLTYLPVFYYAPTLPMNFVSDAPGGSTDTLSRATRKILGVNDAPVIASSVGSAQRVWFVIYQQSVKEYVAAGYATHEHLQYLEEHFILVSQTRYGDVLLYQFERKP